MEFKEQVSPLKLKFFAEIHSLKLWCIERGTPETETRSTKLSGFVSLKTETHFLKLSKVSSRKAETNFLKL